RGPHARRRGRRPAMGPARLRGAGAHLEQRPRHPRVVPRAARPPRGGPRDLSGPGVARRFTPAPPRGDGADTSAPYLPQLPGRPPLRRTRRNPRRGRHVTSNLRRWTTFLALPLAGALLAGACSGDEDAGADGSASGGGLSGSVVISGSSTVEPISIAVAEKFNEQHPDVDVPVDGPGTGDGFELFCNGETDINDASSKVKDEQLEACEANGIEMIELKIGNDGIAV